MSELLPCPHCGEHAEVVELVRYRHDYSAEYSFGVLCDSGCNESHRTEAKAIAAWNRRVSDQVESK